MAKKNMRNEFEFMASVLDALGVEYEEADIKVRERWRGKVLEGWGVSYIPDDVKQFERWRGKCIEGLSKGGGGKFTTAKVTIGFDGDNPYASVGFIDPQNTLGLVYIQTSSSLTYDVPLYDGKAFIGLSGSNNGVVISGDATYVTGTDYGKGFIVTGDCSLGVSRGAM